MNDFARFVVTTVILCCLIMFLYLQMFNIVRILVLLFSFLIFGRTYAS